MCTTALNCGLQGQSSFLLAIPNCKRVVKWIHRKKHKQQLQEEHTLSFSKYDLSSLYLKPKPPLIRQIHLPQCHFASVT